jgi:hypothetical protein
MAEEEEHENKRIRPRERARGQKSILKRLLKKGVKVEPIVEHK